MDRVTENHSVTATFSPSAGCYTNFSARPMRQQGGLDVIKRVCDAFGEAAKEHIRIPREVEKDGKGYVEDRRPAANCDPYAVTAIMMETTGKCLAPEPAKAPAAIAEIPLARIDGAADSLGKHG